MRRLDRLGDDHGAVAVMVALLMVVLIGAAAIAVDVGDLYGERRILQNGADAAALAIAQDCADGSCGDTSGTAADFIASNYTRGRAGLADVSFPEDEPYTVRVTSRSTVPHNFARALGFDQTDVGAAAGAAWGSPSAGTTMLPLTISWCAFDPSNFDTEQLIRSHGQLDEDCAGPGGMFPPGGFGYLNTSGGCSVDVSIGEIGQSTGNNLPCNSADLEQYKNEIVLIPIFSDYQGSGSGGTYTIHGFAAFRLTGWRFSGGDNWNNTTSPSCTGSCRGIKGYFTEFVSLDDAWELGGPDLGGSVVRLTL